MKTKLILLALLVCATSVAVMIGCGSDDDGGGTITGNTNDPNFASIADVNDGAAEMHVDLVVLNFGLMGGIEDNIASRASAGPAAAFERGRDVDVVEASYSYNSGSGWHVATIDSAWVVKWSSDGMTAWVDSTLYKGIDSLRFTDTAGAYLSHHFDTANLVQIESHSVLTILAPDSPTIYDTSSYTLAGHFAGTLTLNGTSHGSVDQPQTDTTCGMSGHFTQTFTGVTIDLQFLAMDYGCPTGGSVALNISLTPDCPDGVEPDSLEPSGNWAMTMTFHNGQMSMTASNGTTTWTRTDWCEPNPTEISSSDSSFVEDAIGGGQLGAFYYDIQLSEGLLGSGPGKAGRAPNIVQSAQFYDDFVVHTVGHNYANGWHIFTFSVYLINSGTDTTTVGGTDSVRVYEGGVVVEQPSDPDSLSRLDVRLHATWDRSYDEAHGKFHHRVDYSAVNYQGNRMASGSGAIADTAWGEYDNSPNGTCDVASALQSAAQCSDI